MNEIEMAKGDILLKQIESIPSLEELKLVIAQLEGLKTALKKAQRFREESIKFAKLEAATLIKVVELGGLGELKGHNKEAAQWLYEMADSERQKYIDMCEDGLTIGQVWKREVKDQKKLSQIIDSTQAWMKDIVDEVKQEGIVDLSAFDNSLRDYILNKDLATDMSQSMRRKLLAAGAIGVGNESKIYVMPESNNTDEVKNAILQRFEDVCEEMDKVYEIAKVSKAQISYKDLIQGGMWNLEYGSPWKIHLIIALSRTNVIYDFDEFMQHIAETDASIEISTIGRAMNISREEYIRREYQALEGGTNGI